MGALALAAVVAVALVARQGTRLEFTAPRRARRARGPVGPHRRATAGRDAVDGRCCDREALAAASARAALRTRCCWWWTRHGTLIASAGARAGTGRSRHDLARTADTGDRSSRRNGGGASRSAFAFRQMAPSLARPTARGAAAPPAVAEPGTGQRVDALLHSMDLRLVWATGLIGALALAVTWAIARSSVRPLGALRAATRELALGRLAARVEPRGSREVVELGRDFNAMADDLERQHLLRQRLLHDVAHELRTPLTALQCRLETVIDGLARDPASGRARPARRRPASRALVDDLQDVALAEAGELRLSIADHAASDLVRSALRAAGLDGDAARQYRRARHPHAARRCPPGATDSGEPAVQRQPAHARRRRHRASRRRPRTATRGYRCATPAASCRPRSASRVFDRFYRTDPARQTVNRRHRARAGDRQASRRSTRRTCVGRKRRRRGRRACCAACAEREGRSLSPQLSLSRCVSRVLETSADSRNEFSG